MNKIHDVLIIGAGVTGTMIARELSKYLLDVVILDKNNDAGDATSSANIAFIDGMIYQGTNPRSNWTKPEDMNAQKKAFADSADNNYIVDTYANAEEKTDENELKPGNPGGDSMHYNTKSSLRLGMVYGKVIVENDLLD